MRLLWQNICLGVLKNRHNVFLFYFFCLFVEWGIDDEKYKLHQSFHCNFCNSNLNDPAVEEMHWLRVLQGSRLVVVGNTEKTNQQKAANAGTFCHCNSGDDKYRRVICPWSERVKAGVWSRSECYCSRKKGASVLQLNGWDIFFLPFESSLSGNRLLGRHRHDWTLTAVQPSS